MDSSVINCTNAGGITGGGGGGVYDGGGGVEKSVDMDDVASVEMNNSMSIQSEFDITDNNLAGGSDDVAGVEKKKRMSIQSEFDYTDNNLAGGDVDMADIDDVAGVEKKKRISIRSEFDNNNNVVGGGADVADIDDVAAVEKKKRMLIQSEFGNTDNIIVGGGDDVADIDEVEGVVKKRKREYKEDEMKRVAEIVLVLAAMGRMRGGRDPTMAEKTMMAEAREKVVALCEELAPKDIVPVEAFHGVIQDLGLDRLKDRLGFRTPKYSISEKLAFTKRRMEESKMFASQPATFTSQRTQTVNGATNESFGTPPTIRSDSANKPSHVHSTTGSFQPPTSSINLSSTSTTPIRYHTRGTEVRSPVVSPVVKNNIGGDSKSVVPSKDDRAHIRPDARPNNVPVSSGPQQHTRRTTPLHLQPQSHPQVNAGTKRPIPERSSARINSNLGSNPPQIISQSVAQMPAQHTVHHPIQNMQFAHAPQAVNHHLEISKFVQRLLIPRLPPRPVWTPPSREYMNRVILCQFCKLVINDVENMVVCDACEKGFHLGCLQSYNAKGLPRGEWHCPRCMSMSHGKMFPPKYGRVTRNLNVPKAPSNSTGAQLSVEKKVGIVDKASLPNALNNKSQDPKTHLPVNQPNVTTHGSQHMKLQTQTVRNGNDISRNDVSTGMKELKPKLEICTNIKGPLVETSLSTSTMPTNASDKPSEFKSEKPCPKDNLMLETEPKTCVISQTNSKPDNLSTSSYQNIVDKKVLDGVENPVLQHSDTNGVAVCNDDEKKDVQKGLVDSRSVDQEKVLTEVSQSGLHNVDWVGDFDQIVDGKKFFQSCRVNGMVYQVQDYALFRSGNGKLIPSKLQAMWEDSQTTTKWLVVRKCYFSEDLPEEVGRPGAPESNEVYESTHDSNVLAGFIQGPCEVRPFRKFGEDTERSDQGSLAKERSQPVFIRNWFYDETKRAFCPSAS